MFLIAEADAVDGDNPYVGGGDDLAQLSYRYEGAPIILHAIIEGKADLLQR